MVEVSFSILFYVKKPKGYEKGDMPVYMRITVNGVPKDFMHDGLTNGVKFRSFTIIDDFNREAAACMTKVINKFGGVIDPGATQAAKDTIRLAAYCWQ